MSLKKTSICRIIICVLTLIFFCECLIYYFVLAQCKWPQLNPKNEEPIINKEVADPVKVMLLADTHLLGSRKGHWFDKLRREWQMERTFQTAIILHKPDIVFVLGDVFDEGLWCSDEEFNYYVERFNTLFSVPATTEIYVVVGNHDIGFHYGISQYLKERFARAFKAPSVRLLTIAGNHFVLINSMAMEGDGCFLCRPAEIQLNKIAGIHFPMYRESDAECNEPDEAPEDLKTQKFRERWECLSREASEMLIDELKPRVILTGHTHHGCHREYKEHKLHEFTIPSFSWRNKDNPSFMMAVFSPNNYAVHKCFMPKETTVIKLYFAGVVLIILIYVLATYYGRFYRRSRLFNLLSSS